jgi:glucosylceramidase
MKDRGAMLKGGKLLPRYRQAWANYYVKFIQAHEQHGIPVWGLSVQNEPMATQKWESCVFGGEEERDFIKGYLGPALAKNGLGAKKLIACDHNRDLVYQRASAVLDDPAAKYAWGIGYHWYETWTGSGMLFDNVRRTHETYPNTNLLFTEGCVEKFKFDQVNDWRLGEKYGMSMIGDFNAGTVGWTDWNILLDETGGPNHVGNFCFAPIIGDTKTGKLIYTNAYYYIGHFAKFIRPGAWPRPQTATPCKPPPSATPTAHWPWWSWTKPTSRSTSNCGLRGRVGRLGLTVISGWGLTSGEDGQENATLG